MAPRSAGAQRPPRRGGRKARRRPRCCTRLAAHLVMEGALDGAILAVLGERRASPPTSDAVAAWTGPSRSPRRAGRLPARHICPGYIDRGRVDANPAPPPRHPRRDALGMRGRAIGAVTATTHPAGGCFPVRRQVSKLCVHQSHPSHSRVAYHHESLWRSVAHISPWVAPASPAAGKCLLILCWEAMSGYRPGFVT